MSKNQNYQKLTKILFCFSVKNSHSRSQIAPAASRSNVSRFVYMKIKREIQTVNVDNAHFKQAMLISILK